MRNAGTMDRVSISQDNYGRWFVEVRQGGRRRAPIRCLSQAEAEAVAATFESKAEDVVGMCLRAA